MGLIGLGLLILGVAAFVLLPKPGLPDDTPRSFAAIPAKVSFAAPELALKDLQGNPVSLAETRGQVVLVNNWATWCPPCKEEMPALEAYYKKHRDQNFNLIAIEAGEPAAEVADFVRQYRLTFPVWLDPGSTATTAFHNDALPSSYVIDTQGAVRLAWSGATDLKTLEMYVTPMLEAAFWMQK
jgi:peroxiredoxin